MMSGFMQSTTSPTVRRGGGLAAMQVGTFDDLPNNIFSAVKTPEIFKINREKNKNFMLRAMARYSIFRDNFEVYEQYKIVFFFAESCQLTLFWLTRNSPLLWKATRSDPGPIFSNCTLNDVTSVLFLQKTIVYYLLGSYAPIYTVLPI